MGNDWVFWIMLIGWVAHGAEELFAAGGFLRNYNEYLAKIGRAPKSLQWLYSVMFFWATPGVILAVVLGSRVLIYSLGTMLGLFINAIAHLALILLSKKYSSGTLSGVLIIIPLTIYSYWLFISSGQLDLTGALWTILVASIISLPTIPYKKLEN